MSGEQHKNFVLRVSAGPSYDETKHQVVNVNSSSPTTFSTDAADAAIKVRVQNYRGLPATAPPTSSWFDNSAHTSDKYGIEFRFTPHTNISGADLVWGNDFDRPIRDRLPPGFNAAFRFVRWWVDPGLEGDAYADKPYLFGPLLSSINVLRVGGKEGEVKKVDSDEALEEGAEDEDGWEARAQYDVPEEAAARKKFFLDASHKDEFEFEKGREYACDFFNPYLDFNEFAVRLPGITIPILKHWDGQPVRDHTLRYVLKDRRTNTTLLVIVFKLLPVSELEEPYNCSTEAGRQAHEASVARAGGGGGGNKQSAGPTNVSTPDPRVPVDDGDDDVD